MLIIRQGMSAISALSPFAGADANAPSIMLVLCAAAAVSPAALPGRPAAPSRVAFASGSVAGVAGQAALPARWPPGWRTRHDAPMRPGELGCREALERLSAPKGSGRGALGAGRSTRGAAAPGARPAGAHACDSRASVEHADAEWGRPRVEAAAVAERAATAGAGAGGATRSLHQACATTRGGCCRQTRGVSSGVFGAEVSAGCSTACAAVGRSLGRSCIS